MVHRIDCSRTLSLHRDALRVSIERCYVPCNPLQSEHLIFNRKVVIL